MTTPKKKTSTPKRTKSKDGDQINIANEGERNVIAAGRNARATAFNINIRDFKWQPVFIVLLIVGGILSAILWYVVPKSAQAMAGQFNVAVAEFLVQDKAGNPISSEDGFQLASYVQSQIGSQFTEIELHKTAPYDIWGPKETGKVKGETPEKRSEAAAALAQKINAHIVIYGVLIEDGNQSKLVPEFYVNHASFHDASEITGQHEIGSPLRVELPFSGAIQAIENKALAGRVNAIDLITIGLAFYSVDDFENATYYFERAAQEERWLENNGKEIVYLLLGNTYIRWASRDDDVKHLPDAEKNYAEALRISPDYGRAIVGQSNVLYLSALGTLDDIQIEPAVLDQADELIKEALELEGQPDSANIPAKAHFSRGQIGLARYTAKVEGSDWLARSKAEFTFVTQEYEAGDTTLQSLASHSYFRLGLIAYYQGDAETSIALIQKAIPLASPFSQGEFSSTLGDIYLNLGQKQDAMYAYQNAVEIAESLGDQKSAQKYQEKLDAVE